MNAEPSSFRGRTMLDDNWETINGPIAHQIELINAANQINVLDGLILFLLAHKGPTGNCKPPMPDETALRSLHQAGTLFLLAEPGSYRNMPVNVTNRATGEIIHQPPDWPYVLAFMQHFFRDLSCVWTSGDALDVAAYALWRINWVHPFRNGNGRTARAFSYACLCVKLGSALPGAPTVIDQIMGNRTRYQEVLKVADDTFEKTRLPDLRPMRDFLHELLQIQILSVDGRNSPTT